MRYELVRSMVALCLCALVGCVPAGHSAPDEMPPADPANAPAIAVANSFIGAVVRDLVGDDVPCIALAEPGMCPGHFDVRPSQLRQVQHCRLLLRFDFQQSVDTLLARAGNRAPHIAVVHVTGGLCEPASFIEAARQVAEAIVAEGLLSQALADERLAAATQRMTDLGAWAREQIVAARLGETPVMTSRHQEAFCRSLGLHVVATFPTADGSVPSEIKEAVAQGQERAVQWIIANLPEGRQAADALADRCGARVVVLGNFPDGQGPDSFDRLVRDNVTSLVKALRP